MPEDSGDDEELQELRRLLTEIGYMPAPESPQDVERGDRAMERTWARVVAERERQAAAGGPAPSSMASGRPGRREPRRHARRRGVWLGVAAVTTAAAVVLGVLQPWAAPSAAAATPPLLTFSVHGEDQDPQSAPAATPELQRAADRAAAQLPTFGPVAEYVIRTADWLLVSATSGRSTTSAVVPYATTVTIGVDGSMDRVERLGVPLTPDGRGVRDGGNPLHAPTLQHDSFPAGFVDTSAVTTLPRDPAALRAALLTSGGCPTGGVAARRCLLRQITEFHTLHQVPGDLDAAFWRVLAAEPGLTSIGRGRDRAGRPCVGIAARFDGGERMNWVLLLDPATGQYLGQEQVLTSGSHDGVRAPAVLEFTTVLPSG